jgi:hydroxypyruvate isomerase
MPKFAANLTMLYNELDFLERFAAAARDGFAGVESRIPHLDPADRPEGRGNAAKPRIPSFTRRVRQDSAT